MSKTIGVIAEDVSDVEVVKSLLKKYIRSSDFTVKHFVGHGCGKIIGKAHSWADNLSRRGCEHILLFHDLDRNRATELRARLTRALPPDRFPASVIVIPKEELEAWLLSDVAAIQTVFSLPTTPRPISDCESIRSPKEYIASLTRRLSQKQYLNTVHNVKISELISLDNLRRCDSFTVFDTYVIDHIVSRARGEH